MGHCCHACLVIASVCRAVAQTQNAFLNDMRLTLEWLDVSHTPMTPPRVLEYVLLLNYPLCCTQVNACYINMLAEIGHLCAICCVIHT